MLLPITYALPPVSALIMLAGIYYGAQYGGSTTSILLNMPGETSSAVTCLDGYQMARKGQAGTALDSARELLEECMVRLPTGTEALNAILSLSGHTYERASIGHGQ